ncbi:polyprenyl synthetase family protein [uncultured Lutibacter sp.]|uniref:polyprenyl synthetase family protein n=1 Tax=uncultured Lutibacter sp. TaxID=437739 RepID=UPI00261B4A0B|nr:polyprenyl synthetase family protein [uncultured Lutibacter sp.]
MSTIETYREEFLTYLHKINTVKEPVNLYEPINYILNIGGKRLRPILTLLTCDIFGGNYTKALDAAVAVEVFHNFTLLHDDIMDSAPIRRGKQTVHTKWNVNTGILSGDAMMIMAYQSFESYEPELFKKLLKLFNQTSLEVCEGQQLDVDFENRTDVTIPEYLKMITNKTSVLVACAMKMGALIANSSDEDAEKIYKFGLFLGLAFQLQDDYLDTFGNVEDFGKQIGGDIMENKKTFLYLKTIELANSKDKKQLLNLYNTSTELQEKVTEVKDLFINYRVDRNIKNEIENYTQKAFDILTEIQLPIEKKQELIAFGNWLMKRKV